MSDKILKLSQAQTLYQDLRGRIDALPTDSDIPEVPVQDVQVNGTSILNNGVANVPVGGNNFGVFRTSSGYGTGIAEDATNYGKLQVIQATTAQIKAGDGIYRPIVPSSQHSSVFYGLAKAAGDTTQSSSSNPVGTYTDEAKAAIQQMLDVPSNDDIPVVTVQDVQVNGTSVVQDGVANVPLAGASGTGQPGVVRITRSFGIDQLLGNLILSEASHAIIAPGQNAYYSIQPKWQHEAAFYGLAKAAGADMKDIANTTVGTYPDAQKEAIQSMLGITQMLAPENPNLVASQAYAIGDVFAANGHLYKATAAIAQDGTIIPDTNCVETTMAEAGGKIKDVQVNGTSVVQNGVANVPVASGSTLGVVKTGANYGTEMLGEFLATYPATPSNIKNGIQGTQPITPMRQHESTFYGLSKVAGVDLKDETVTLGTYPEASKTAIRSMIGATSSNVIAVQDTQPTDSDTKIWIDDDASGSVQVPTVSEMQSALATKIDDVQINGMSVVANGVANVPLASDVTFGAAKFHADYGLAVTAGQSVRVNYASDARVKSGVHNYTPIVPSNQHRSTFYGLAKAAGVDEKNSTLAFGTYTDAAKIAIKNMIGVEEGLKVVRLI